MKIFLLFSLAFLVYAEVPDCPNGYLKFDHTKTRVVFPSDGNLQIFPDNYVCQLQITVPLGYFATLTIDVESANPGNSAPVKVIDQTNQAEDIFRATAERFYLVSQGGSINLSTGDSKTQFRVIIEWKQYPPTPPAYVYPVWSTQIYNFDFHSPIFYSQADSQISTYVAHATDPQSLQALRGLIFFDGPYWNSTILGTGRQLFDRKSQFVTSNDEHFLTVLFLGDPTATVINFVANLYELTQQFTEIQALVYPKDWTGELSMDASKGKSLVQTWAQAYQREPAIIQGVLNINGNGSLAVYANLSLPILVNPIATYDASNTGNQLPQQVYGPASSYLLTGGKSKITLSNDKNKLEQTKNFGRTGYFASQNFGTPDRIQDFEFGLTGVANSTTRTIFHLDFITMYFKGDEDYLTIAVFEDGAQVTERNYNVTSPVKSFLEIPGDYCKVSYRSRYGEYNNGSLIHYKVTYNSGIGFSGIFSFILVSFHLFAFH